LVLGGNGTSFLQETMDKERNMETISRYFI
jgi:hypothetical protein